MLRAHATTIQKMTSLTVIDTVSPAFENGLGIGVDEHLLGNES